jgi:hypothetical protein
MSLILFVLNDPDQLQAVLAAWERTGVGGVRQKEGLRDDIPLLPGLEDFYRHDADTSHTLFTIVDTDEMVQKVVQATRQVVGDLDQPGRGILAVLPTTSVHGLIRYPRPGQPEA